MGVIAEKHGDLKKHPLVYTLFMLRFPLQASLDDAVPSIQNLLKKDYPIYERRMQQSIEISQGRDGQTISTNSVAEHLFFDGERKNGLVIKNDRLVFHSPIYPGFEKFNTTFIFAIQALVNALSLTHYVGLGIRYIDALIPDYDDSESLKDLLKNSLLSFEVEDKEISECVSSRQISQYETSEGMLILKANLLSENDNSVPPELRDLSSLLRFDEKEKKGQFAVLDFDHGFVAPDSTAINIDLKKIRAKALRMHDITSRAFLAAINEDNIRKWQ